jgi:hypothetical protein
MPGQAKSVESSQDEQKRVKQKRLLLEETSNQEPYADLGQAYAEAPGDAPIQPGYGLLDNPKQLTAQRQALAVRLGRQQGNKVVTRMILQGAHRGPRSPKETDRAHPSVSSAPAVTHSIEEIRPTIHPNPNLPRRAPVLERPAMQTEQVAPDEDKKSVESFLGPKEPLLTDDQKVSYAAATTPVLNDITPSTSTGLTTVRFADVKIEARVYENGDTGDWIIQVSDASTTIHWGITTGGYQIPNPVDGGNITQENYRDVIKELAGYQARQYSGTWHHPDASSTHELKHVDWYSTQIKNNWPAIQARIDAKVLGNKSSMTKAQAETAMRTYLDEERRKWFDSYGLAPEPEAYAVGQAVLNIKIREIEDYAASKGWNP